MPLGIDTMVARLFWIDRASGIYINDAGILLQLLISLDWEVSCFVLICAVSCSIAKVFLLPVPSRLSDSSSYRFATISHVFTRAFSCQGSRHFATAT